MADPRSFSPVSEKRVGRDSAEGVRILRGRRPPRFSETGVNERSSRIGRLAMAFAAITSCWLPPANAPAQDATLPLLFEENFEQGAERWQPTDAQAWRLIKAGAGQAYNQFQQSKYNPPFRSPLNISLIKDLSVTDFVLEAKLQSTGKDADHRDMCLFFGYQDPAHFYYVHLGKKADDHANQIFIVNGAARTKISKTSTPGTPWDDDWHRVKIVRRVRDGSIAIFFDDMKTPIMTAEDKTFAWGRVGLGSFDDTGNWDDVKLHGLKK
jgi:hypothetical protein